jgi:hypothetical protein
MWEQFNFDLPFQRKYVRGKDRDWQSLLIHTIMTDGYVPNLLVWKNGDTIGVNSKGKPKYVYYAVDCKQRMTTLYLFINDQFALSNETPMVGDENVAGLKFSELPEHLQQAIKGYSFAVTIFDESYTLEDVEEIFYRVNQTKPLSDIEQSQVLLGEYNRSVLIRFSETDLFKRVNFTRADLLGYVDRKTVAQVIALLSGRSMSFSKTDMNKYFRDIGKNEFNPEILSEMEESVAYLEEALKDWTAKMDKAGLKKSVIPSLFVAVRRAKQLSISPADFGAWAKKILIDEYDINSEFGETLNKKTSNREVIQRRTQLMLESLEAFVSAQAG